MGRQVGEWVRQAHHKEDYQYNMNTIKECFEEILRGNKDESRRAARRVRELAYSSGVNDKYEDIKNLIKNAPAAYEKISEDWKRENFTVAVSVIYFLRDEEIGPDFLFPWFFQLLLHPNGVIRYASVRMLSCDLGPLTVYIRVPGFKPDGLVSLKPEQADTILFSLFMDLNKLLEIAWKPEFKKYKYISSLPSSLYKSIQMVMAEIDELCGTGYMVELAEKYSQKIHLIAHCINQ